MAISLLLFCCKAAKDLSYLKGNHCCGWLRIPGHGVKRNPTENTLSRSCLQTAHSQRQIWSWPAQRRKTIRGHGIQMCRQQGADRSWGHAKCPNYAKKTYLIWNAGICHTSPQADFVRTFLQLSTFLSIMGYPLSLPVKRGSCYYST